MKKSDRNPYMHEQATKDEMEFFRVVCVFRGLFSWEVLRTLKSPISNGQLAVGVVIRLARHGQRLLKSLI
jgi:hypothetical protein